MYVYVCVCICRLTCHSIHVKGCFLLFSWLYHMWASKVSHLHQPSQYCTDSTSTSGFTRLLGIWIQLLRLVWQALLPTELSYGPENVLMLFGLEVKKELKQGAMMHAYNWACRRLRQEKWKFQAGLGNVERHCLKIKTNTQPVHMYVYVHIHTQTPKSKECCQG